MWRTEICLRLIFWCFICDFLLLFSFRFFLRFRNMITLSAPLSTAWNSWRTCPTTSCCVSLSDYQIFAFSIISKLYYFHLATSFVARLFCSSVYFVLLPVSRHSDYCVQRCYRWCQSVVVVTLTDHPRPHCRLSIGFCHLWCATVTPLTSQSTPWTCPFMT